MFRGKQAEALAEHLVKGQQTGGRTSGLPRIWQTASPVRPERNLVPANQRLEFRHHSAQRRTPQIHPKGKRTCGTGPPERNGGHRVRHRARRTPIDLHNKLRAMGEKLTSPQVEQIAAKYRIELAEGAKLPRNEFRGIGESGSIPVRNSMS